MPKNQPHQELELVGSLSELVGEFLAAVAKLEGRVLAIEEALKTVDLQHAALLRLCNDLAKDRLPAAKKKVLN